MRNAVAKKLKRRSRDSLDYKLTKQNWNTLTRKGKSLFLKETAKFDRKLVKTN